jgi:hypothetical protein
MFILDYTTTIHICKKILNLMDEQYICECVQSRHPFTSGEKRIPNMHISRPQVAIRTAQEAGDVQMEQRQ